MSILKEMIKAATGIEIEVHNVIVDFRTPDGKSAHRRIRLFPVAHHARTKQLQSVSRQICRRVADYAVSMK